MEHQQSQSSHLEILGTIPPDGGYPAKTNPLSPFIPICNPSGLIVERNTIGFLHNAERNPKNMLLKGRQPLELLGGTNRCPQPAARGYAVEPVALKSPWGGEPQP